MGIRPPELSDRSVTPRKLAFMFAFVYPGAVAAGTKISLPDYAKGASKLIQALHLARSDVKHAACGATGAAYPSETTLATVVSTCKNLTIVTTTPAAGQIQLVDENNVVLGDATADGDLLILVLEY